MMEEPAPASSPAKSARPVAVIDIGATAVRMEIAEIDEQGHIRVLDALRQGVPLGKDTFTKGRIEQSTIQQVVDVLKGFRLVMEDYGNTRP